MRSAKAAVVADYLTGSGVAAAYSYDVSSGVATKQTGTTAPATTPADTTGESKVYTTIGVAVDANGTVTFGDGTMTVDFTAGEIGVSSGSGNATNPQGNTPTEP